MYYTTKKLHYNYFKQLFDSYNYICVPYALFKLAATAHKIVHCMVLCVALFVGMFSPFCIPNGHLHQIPCCCNLRHNHLGPVTKYSCCWRFCKFFVLQINVTEYL